MRERNEVGLRKHEIGAIGGCTAVFSEINCTHVASHRLPFSAA